MTETILNVSMVVISFVLAIAIYKLGKDNGYDEATEEYIEFETYEDGYEIGFKEGKESVELEFLTFVKDLEKATNSISTKKVSKKVAAKKSK